MEEKLTLWNATIANIGFDNLNGIILQVKIYLAFPYSVLLSRFLMNGLLKVGVEPQHLSVKGNPGWCSVALPGRYLTLGRFGFLAEQALPSNAGLVFADQHGHIIAVVKVVGSVKLLFSKLST